MFDLAKIGRPETDPLRIEVNRSRSALTKLVRERDAADDSALCDELSSKVATARTAYLAALDAVIAAPRPSFHREPQAPAAQAQIEDEA